MHKIVVTPNSAARHLHQKTRTAVQRRRVGNLSADHGLDALNFCLADVQTGFGPFIAVYLTTRHWSTVQLGTALGIGTVVTMVAQIPAGALIDAIPAKRGVTLVALFAVLSSAVLLAALPFQWPVIAAEVLHGVASCMLVPAVAAVTLSRVGREAFARRLGRNTRFMAIGNAIGAGAMGAAGAYLSASAPFWLTAAIAIPAILALLALPPRHHSEPRPEQRGPLHAAKEGWSVLCDRRLLMFSFCAVLFHGSNAFILPLAMNRLTKHIGGDHTNLVLGLCLIIAQSMVAIIAPWIGRSADRVGRRPILILGFAAVPLHAALLAIFSGPYAIIGTQILDGMGGAMFGVLQPLVASDITKGTNRFNLSLGVLGLAAGLGATVSNTLGGKIAASYGDVYGFGALALFGSAAVCAVWLLMDETRPSRARRDCVDGPANQT